MLTQERGYVVVMLVVAVVMMMIVHEDNDGSDKPGDCQRRHRHDEVANPL